MQKKLIAVIFLIIIGLFAFAEKNSYDFVFENNSFAELMKNINTDKGYSAVNKSYMSLMSQLDSNQNSIVIGLRAKTAYMEYVNNLNDKKNKTELKQILAECYSDLDKLAKMKTSSVITDSITFLVYGLDYRVTGSISKGTKSIKLIDDCYANNKDDIGIAALYAQRKAQAPKIGGGDVDEALQVCNSILKNIEKQSKSVKFDVYSTLAYCYDKKGDSKKASDYKSKALSQY